MSKYAKVMTAIAIGSSIVMASSVASALKIYSRLKAERHEWQVEREVWANERGFNKRAEDQKVADAIAAAEKEKAKQLEKDAKEQLIPGEEPKVMLVREMSVDYVSYAGDDEIELQLSEIPDMDSVREYISVEPLNEGAISFRYSQKWGFNKKARIWDYQPTLTISGDFAYRKTCTLKIRKGFEVSEKGYEARENTLFKPLAEDFDYKFERNDKDPAVDFADSGRYLPPVGERLIAVKSVNASKFRTEVREIPSANIVQLLALENSAYNNIYKGWVSSYTPWRKEEFALDISGEGVKNDFEVSFEPNKETKSAVPIKYEGDTIANGVYLVALGIENKNASREEGEEGFYKYRYRVVCISDLALSARGDGDELLVWVNSLTTGNTVEGAKVEVYSSANVLVARGVTDSSGLCRPDKIAAGEPFCIVASSAGGDDKTFMALREGMKVGETFYECAARPYLKDKESVAFVWTDRGIYRHDEKVFFNILLRDGKGKAPEPFPVEVVLKNPSYDEYLRLSMIADDKGAICCEDFCIPEDQPSGTWSINVKTPGKNGILLGSTSFKVEEFAPPQVRVRAEIPEGQNPQAFSFAVAAEHLYGGAASGLFCEGAIVFEDASFEPAGWKGYRFGDESRTLTPNHKVLPKEKLDGAGRHVYAAGMDEAYSLPGAMVRAIIQATVFEDGGRDVNSRSEALCHYYPYYIGAKISHWIHKPESGAAKIAIALVDQNGARISESKRLEAKLEHIRYIHSYKTSENGWATWESERVKETVAEKIALSNRSDEDTVLALPANECGDYILSIEDLDSNVRFSYSFYLSDWGDDEVKAPLNQPASVGITLDKSFYRVGESPRLIVKAPFAGNALVTLMRDRVVHKEVIRLECETSEIVLPPMREEWAPNLGLSISVVQGVRPADNHFAVRAHGEATISVRPQEREILPKLDAQVVIQNDGGSKVVVDIGSGVASDKEVYAILTVVDEGINLLTSQETPDPIGFFSQPRTAAIPLFDLYHKLLPVAGDDILRASGVKTGGGLALKCLSRVSPVKSRRFIPLSLWEKEIRLPSDGSTTRVVFNIPEFIGEVRITAFLYSSCAAGSASIQKKVAPQLIAQPDAPRFVAPGDEFVMTLPLTNRSQGDEDVSYSVTSSGDVEIAEEGEGIIRLAKDETRVVSIKAKANGVGEGEIAFMATGAGEVHTKKIYLPVRPTVTWREEAGVDILKPGESKIYPKEVYKGRSSYTVSASRLAELAAALEWLAEYPHGCLEQTTSRVFPLVAAGGILNNLSTCVASNREEFVVAGVKRIESMIRSTDFVMWPDCDYAPWDREVSLYAAHFLLEAEKVGIELNPVARPRVLKFLNNWAKSEDAHVAAYACHTLALAGASDKGRMLQLYNDRDRLDLLSRARLARAFVAVADRKRAQELLKTAVQPESVKDAAFALLALLEMDSKDERIPGLVLYLTEMRDKSKFSWGTTETNAHALMALGEYYRYAGARAGDKFDCKRIDMADGSVQFVNAGTQDAFISWRRLYLPKIEDMKNESNMLSIERKYYTSEGEELDLADIKRGDLVIAALKISSSVNRLYSDLVIEDLFPGAFEPVRNSISAKHYPWIKDFDQNMWVMRSDARDDRMLIFSKKFDLGGETNKSVTFYYPLRAVSSGNFTAGEASVEAMYDPCTRGCVAPCAIRVAP